MLSAFKAVAAEKDFQEKVRLVLFLLFLLEPLTRTRATLTHLGSSRSQLDNVRDRVDFIEALHRTVRPLSLPLPPHHQARRADSLPSPRRQRELTVKTGEGDLGGFLRLRIGNLGPEHEKREEDDDDGDDGGNDDGPGDADDERGEQDGAGESDGGALEEKREALRGARARLAEEHLV